MQKITNLRQFCTTFLTLRKLIKLISHIRIIIVCCFLFILHFITLNAFLFVDTIMHFYTIQLKKSILLLNLSVLSQVEIEINRTKIS